jgi:hypothetical protein
MSVPISTKKNRSDPRESHADHLLVHPHGHRNDRLGLHRPWRARPTSLVEGWAIMEAVVHPSSAATRNPMTVGRQPNGLLRATMCGASSTRRASPNLRWMVVSSIRRIEGQRADPGLGSRRATTSSASMASISSSVTNSGGEEFRGRSSASSVTSPTG